MAPGGHAESGTGSDFGIVDERKGTVKYSYQVTITCSGDNDGANFLSLCSMVLARGFVGEVLCSMSLVFIDEGCYSVIFHIKQIGKFRWMLET